MISFRKGTCWLTTHARAKWEAFVPPPLYTLAGSGSRSLIGRVFLIFSTLQQGRRSFITFRSQWLLSGAYRTANEWVRAYTSQFPLFLPPRGCFAVAMACAVSQRRRRRRPTKTNSPPPTPPPSLWLSFGWHGRKRSTKKKTPWSVTPELSGGLWVCLQCCVKVWFVTLKVKELTKNNTIYQCLQRRNGIQRLQTSFAPAVRSLWLLNREHLPDCGAAALHNWIIQKTL